MNTITPKIFSEITAQVATAIDEAYTSPASRFADAESFLTHTNRKLDEIIERFASLGGLEPDLVSYAVAEACETWMQLNATSYEAVAARFAQAKLQPAMPKLLFGDEGSPQWPD